VQLTNVYTFRFTDWKRKFFFKSNILHSHNLRIYMSMKINWEILRQTFGVYQLKESCVNSLLSHPIVCTTSSPCYRHYLFVIKFWQWHNSSCDAFVEENVCVSDDLLAIIFALLWGCHLSASFVSQGLSRDICVCGGLSRTVFMSHTHPCVSDSLSTASNGFS